MKVHHVGYLVSDIESACAEFQKLGYHVAAQSVFDEARKIFIAFMENENLKQGGVLIELIQPAEGCELFPKRLRQLGSVPYHMCYECKNLEESISELRQENFVLIREPQPASAIGNRRVAFMYSAAIGQIELLEGGE